MQGKLEEISIAKSPLKSFVDFKGKNLRLELFNSIIGVEDAWDEQIDSNQLFFRAKYFQLLEKVPPPQLQFYYCLLFDGDKKVGNVYFQINHFNAYQSLNLDNEKARNRNSWGGSIITASKEYVAKSLDFKGIIMGNLLTTGQNAYWFSIAQNKEDEVALADATLDEVRTILIDGGLKVRLAFIKDFHQDIFNAPYLTKQKCEEYYRLDAQPNMYLTIDPNWSTQEDYFSAFKSKYRVGAKKALKCLIGIEKRILTREDINKWGKKMHQLYMNIADSAGFNLFFLHENYFRQVHEDMAKECTLYGYFRGDVLVAFYSVFDLGVELDAHFLGYEMELNKTHQLYKNILIDLVMLGIEQKKNQVNFSRTAMEIKSSIGAVDEDMSCYIQHRNKLQNVLYAKFFDWLKPENNWVIRKPFK